MPASCSCWRTQAAANNPSKVEASRVGRWLMRKSLHLTNGLARKTAMMTQFSFWRWCSLGDPRKHEMKTSLSRRASKVRIISSKELPVGMPQGLNTQAHSAQPKPRRRVSSIQTSLRAIRLLAPACDMSHSSSGECFGRLPRSSGAYPQMIRLLFLPLSL